MSRKRGKLFIYMLSAVLLASALQTTAYGAGLAAFRDNADYLQGYVARENAIEVFIASMEDGTPSPEQFAASLEGTELPVAAVTTAEGQPVTYYCLADVSGSLNQAQLSQEKEVLHALCEQLSEGDQMVVVTVGNEAAASGYLTDKEEIARAIDALAITPEDTNLYTAIAESIRALDGSNSAAQRKCLVVLTDGEDYQQAGQTKSDADRAIQDTKIPVYTVALMRQANVNNEKWIEFAKLLGSLARESVGGAHFNPTLDGTDGGSVGRSIAANMKNDLALTLDLSAFTPEKEELALLVSYDTSDGSTYGDSMTVYRQNLDLPRSEEEALYLVSLILTDQDGEPLPAGTAVTLTGEDGMAYHAAMEENGTVSLELPEGSYMLDVEGCTVPEGAAVQVSADGDNSLTISLEKIPEQQPEPDRSWIWLAAAAAVLAIVLAIIAVRRSKKKKAEKKLVLPDPDDKNDDKEIEKPDQPFEPMQEKPKARVLFTAIGYEQIHFELEIEMERELTLGRDNRADLILNLNDKKLSGVNSRIVCSGRSLRVWDAGSMNGTAVNGVPLGGGASAIVEDGQTLRVGDYEYRVQFIEEY